MRSKTTKRAFKIEGDILSKMVKRKTNWKKLLCVMAFVMKRMQKILADENGSNVLTVEDMRSAEIIVLLYLKK